MLSKIDSPIRTKKERISESVRIVNRVPKGVPVTLLVRIPGPKCTYLFQSYASINPEW